MVTTKISHLYDSSARDGPALLLAGVLLLLAGVLLLLAGILLLLAAVGIVWLL